MRGRQWWNPVDVIVHSQRGHYLVRLHGRIVGFQADHRLYVVKSLHRRVEAGCGQHETYTAPWD